MKILYRGYEIEAKRDKALGGWTNTYYSAFRKRDGYGLIDSFTEGNDGVRYWVKWMKKVVDVLIDKYGGRVAKLDDAIEEADNT